jgi:Zn-dependent M16 (insulinase) family peptidase
MFVCGLKDIEKSAVPKVEEIIFTALKDLAEKGIEKHLIESAIHQIEFYRKEITNTPYPFGIKLLLSFAGMVIHGGDPVACINIDDDLERLKKEIDAGPFLEEKIKTFFLDNPHRLLFTLEPDTELEADDIEKTKAELKAKLSSLTPEDLEQIRSDAKALEALQETEEDLTVLPTLELDDVPPEIEIIHPDTIDQVKLATCYDKATSGILYFTCPVGAGKIPADLFGMAPFFCKAFTNSGTAKSSYVQLAERMDLYTGGVSMSPFSGSYFSKEGDSHSFLALQGKALDRNIDNLFDLIDEYVNAYGFSDHERLKSLLLQYQAGMEASIVSTGHRYAISLSAMHLSKASYINELWHGIAQYRNIKDLTARVSDEKTGQAAMEALCRDLSDMAMALLKKDNFKPAVIGAAPSLIQADKRIRGIHDTLTNGTDKAFFHTGHHL